jgi:hypothetical protein
MGATVSVTVVGQNLGGATFTLAPAGGATAIAVNSNNGSTAVLSVTLSGDGEQLGDYAVVATTPFGNSGSLIGANNRFRIILASGWGWSTVAVVNSFIDPATSTAALRQAASPVVAVVNSFLDTTTITASLRNALSSPVAVINTYIDPAGLNTSFRDAASTVVAVRNTALAPLSTSLAVSAAKDQAAANAAAVPGAKLPQLTGAEGLERLVAGQTIRLRAEDIDGEASATVQFLVNGRLYAESREAPHELLFTAPAGMAELSFQILAVDAAGNQRLSNRLTLPVVGDSGVSLAGTLRDAAGAPLVGAAITAWAGGLTAEYYDSAEPLSRMPDPEAAPPTRTGVVTTLNQPNPHAMFGPDPLGTGMAPDLAARFHGQIWIEQDGEYRFWLLAQDGARLSLDGKQVLEAADGAEAAADLPLARGWHRLEASVWQGVRPTALRVDWQRPGVRREPVSPEFLRTRLAAAAESGADGGFRIGPLPAALDTVWLVAEKDNLAIASPALRPAGADKIELKAKE